MIPLLEKLGFDIRDPWQLTPQSVVDEAQKLPYGQERKDAFMKVDKMIAINNEIGLEQSDIIVAILDGPDVDSGTAAEIGYGTPIGKTSFGYRSDFRLCSDNEGSKVNLEIEHCIHKNGGKIVTTIEELEKALREYKEKFLKQEEN
jgi:nucleoside 2-deoxyribosyltransferase